MKKPIAALIMALMLIALLGGMGHVFASPPTMTRPVQIWDAGGDTAGVTDNGALVGTIVDADGDFIKVDSKGALDVIAQDPTSDIVDLYMHIHIGAAITITSDTAIDDTIINVESGHGAVAGNLICLKESQRFYQGTILSTTATTLTLDSPLDYAFTAGSNCTPTSRQLAVDGSSTTQIAHIRPPAGVKWHVVRVLFFLEGTAAMDSGKFGDIAAITKGIVLRKKDGEYHNIFNVKTNGDFASRAYDISYDDKAPAGTTALRVRRTFGGPSKNGTVVELSGTLPEDLQLLIQDDLTGLVNFYMIVQGHVVVD